MSIAAVGKLVLLVQLAYSICIRRCANDYDNAIFLLRWPISSSQEPSVEVWIDCCNLLHGDLSYV